MSKGWRCNFNDCECTCLVYAGGSERLYSAHPTCPQHSTLFNTRAGRRAAGSGAPESPRRACRIKTRTRETPRRARGAAPRGACPWDLRTGDRNCEPNRGLISHTTPMTRREHERSEMSFVTGVGDDKTRAQLGFRTSRSDRARRIATVHRSGATGAHACATAARHLQHWSMSLEEVPQL